MKRGYAIALALLTWGPLVAARAQQPKAATSDPAKEVEEAYERHIDAILKKDLRTLERIWADGYVFTNSRGMLVTKAQRLENLRTGATAIEDLDVQDVRVRVYGDAAVSTARIALKGRYSGKEAIGGYRTTAFWVKTPGGWQMVANQQTPIAR
jgi:ketosteroid isomerase-like protein